MTKQSSIKFVTINMEKIKDDTTNVYFENTNIYSKIMIIYVNKKILLIKFKKQKYYQTKFCDRDVEINITSDLSSGEVKAVLLVQARY